MRMVSPDYFRDLLNLVSLLGGVTKLTKRASARANRFIVFQAGMPSPMQDFVPFCPKINDGLD